MRALVTGAGGFLGRALVGELRSEGDDVRAVVRPSSAVPAELEGATVVRADLRAPAAIGPDALDGVDVIYHLAASLMPPWRSMFESNVIATEHLVAALASAGWRGRFVHVSTFSVYGLNQLPAGATVDEDTPLEPEPAQRDDYAWTKLLQERLIRAAAQEQGFELAIVRPGAVYGPGRSWQHRIGRQLSERAVVMFGGGNALPLTYVENTASLISAAGRHPAAAGQVFNAVDPAPPTQREFLARWRRARGGRTVVIPVPLAVLRAAGAAYTAAEQRSRGAVSPPALLRPYVITPTMRPFRYAPSRAERVLGWRAPIAPDEGIRRTLDE
ncbi:MAG TPA: NAD(P)-dependent oxidoreductase [Solirubrobacteraceae bacterium]|nr:NAD(P)-dependent oxidoreductase [Solirubrobacteraceae bacterium]